MPTESTTDKGIVCDSLITKVLDSSKSYLIDISILDSSNTQNFSGYNGIELRIVNSEEQLNQDYIEKHCDNNPDAPFYIKVVEYDPKLNPT